PLRFLLRNLPGRVTPPQLDRRQVHRRRQRGIHPRLLAGPIVLAVERPVVSLQLVRTLAQHVPGALVLIEDRLQPVALDRADFHAYRTTMGLTDDREAPLGVNRRLFDTALHPAIGRDGAGRAAPHTDL